MKVSDTQRTVLITAAGLVALTLRLLMGAGTTLELGPIDLTACDEHSVAIHTK